MVDNYMYASSVKGSNVGMQLFDPDFLKELVQFGPLALCSLSCFASRLSHAGMQPYWHAIIIAFTTSRVHVP